MRKPRKPARKGTPARTFRVITTRSRDTFTSITFRHEGGRVWKLMTPFGFPVVDVGENVVFMNAVEQGARLMFAAADACEPDGPTPNYRGVTGSTIIGVRSFRA